MGEPFGKREIFRKYPDVVDVTQLSRRKRYAVAQLSAQTTGMFSRSNLPDERWHLQRAENGTVWLYFSDGMVFMLR